MLIPFAMTLLLATVFDWQRLPAIPDAEGFAGSFAGASGDALLVAGGANFPRGRPWEGGAKVWHDRVFVLPDGADAWQSAGRLPAPLGYGVSVTHAGRVVCCGGSDDARHHAVTFALAWDGKRLSRTDLPPLPRPLAQHCGALLGSRLYVVGGTETPTDTAASGRVFWLDLARPADGWREAEPLPGRILAVAGVAQETLYVCGGAGLRAGADGRAERIWLRDAYRLDPDTGWRRIADLPSPRVAAPSPATAPGAAFMILGGDDGGERETPPDRHPGFRREVLAYDPAADRWNDVGALPFALVTTPAVPWRGGVVIPGGEARPGVRSTEVWWAAPARPSAERPAP